MSTQGFPQRCASCAIRHRGICAALSEEELNELNRIARLRRVAAGKVISGDSEPGIACANIVSGVVKLSKMLSDGRQQIVGLQFAPDFLGRTFADSNPYTAEAATDVELCSFPRKEFEDVVRKYPDLEHRLFSDMLGELDAAREWMLLLGRKTAQEKVASFLLLLARRAAVTGCSHSKDPGVTQFQLPLTRADMADYLGLTLETVSRQITRLKTSGVLKLGENREVLVPDPDVLRGLAGD